MVQMVFGRYDRNGNGVLEKDEWAGLGSDPAGYDTNHDGKITREEFAAVMAARFGGGRGRGGEGEGDRGRWYTRREGEESPPGAGGEQNASPAAASTAKKSYRVRTATERLAKLEGLPEWFARTDANGDGQIQMSEYSTSWSDQVVADFSQFDLNKDGIVTPGECVKAAESGAVQGSAPAGALSNDSDRRGRGRRDRDESSERDREGRARPEMNARQTPAAKEAASGTARRPPQRLQVLRRCGCCRCCGRCG